MTMKHFFRGSIIFMCGLPGHAGAPYMYGGSFQEMEQHQFCCCHFPSSYVVVVCWLVIIWKNFSSDLISLQDPLLRLQVCSERPDGGALHWAKTGKLKQREACICIFVKSSQKNDAIARSLLKIMSYFRLTLEIVCTWCWSAPLS